jgi:hypothetical protein
VSADWVAAVLDLSALETAAPPTAACAMPEVVVADNNDLVSRESNWSLWRLCLCLQDWFIVYKLNKVSPY